ncbi:MAG: hypothetical protein M3Z50_08870 [Actinomycetota bacterium]|nr:hypothetical protein [Actinomycetota bacterium]
MARLLLVGSLVLVACSSTDSVDRAFEKLDSALPSHLRQVTEKGAASSHTARYEAKGEPAEAAALVRSSLASQGFMFFPGSGLPDPSVTQPQPPPAGPNLAPSGGPGSISVSGQSCAAAVSRALPGTARIVMPIGILNA